jgi:pre-rRNA-processing protein TSR1
MSSTPGFQHRPTGSKQQNKSFKSGKHSSKGELKRAAAGKVNKNDRTQGFKSTNKLMVESKLTRKIRAKQLAAQKRQKAIQNNRVGLGDSPPRIVAIIGLTPSVNCTGVQDNLISSVLESEGTRPLNSDEGKKIGGVTVCSKPCQLSN